MLWKTTWKYETEELSPETNNRDQGKDGRGGLFLEGTSCAASIFSPSSKQGWSLDGVNTETMSNYYVICKIKLNF